MNDKKDGRTSETARGDAAQKRPHATLDLKATEVKSDASEAGATSTDTSPPSEKSAANASSKAAASEAKVDTAATAEAKTRAEAATRAAAREINQRSAAAAGTSAANERGGPTLVPFITHLFAGIAGGVLVMLALEALPPRQPVNTLEAAAAKVRVEDLEQRLGALEKSTPKGADDAQRQKIAELEQRLGGIEGAAKQVEPLGAAQGQLAGEVKALSDKLAQASDPAEKERLGKLEERLSLMAAQDSTPGTDGRLPQLAAITGKIADVETGLGGQIAALRKDIPGAIEARVGQVSETAEAAKAATVRLDRDLTAVRTDSARVGQRVEAAKAESDRLGERVEAAQEEMGKVTAAMDEVRRGVDAQLKGVAKPADIAAAVGPVAGRLAALEQNLQGVVKSEADRKANAERIVLSLELANLKRVLDRGQGYEAELEQVRKASGGTLDLVTLDKFKADGVPALPEIETELRPLIHAVIDADTEPADGSVVDRLIAGAKSVVRVRKVSHTTDDTSAEATMARVEEAVRDGRLGEAIAQAKTIPPRASAPLQAWLAKVEARHAVDEALARIEAQLKASLAGTGPDPAAPAKPPGKASNAAP